MTTIESVLISDGRRVEARATTAEAHETAIVVVQPNGAECIHHYLTTFGHLAPAAAEARRLAAGIEFDLAWIARKEASK